MFIPIAADTHPEMTPVAVSSMLMRVRELESSVAFYCEVFGCTDEVRDAGAALLLAPDGFQIYLYADLASTPRSISSVGVREVMWSARSAAELDEVAARMRARYPATYAHSVDGVNFVDGRDPDGNRVLVAYPSPMRLPRHAIAARFR